MAATEIINVNALAELERSGIAIEWSTQDEVKILCPFHPDTSPSLHLNIKSNLFSCKSASCNKLGDIITLFARILNTTRAVVIEDLSSRYPLSNDKLIAVETVERYHSAIWKALPLLNALYARGLDDNDIRKYRLGEIEGRISIPISNVTGHYVNIRKYLPGAPGKDKMRNVKGHGTIRLFPLEQMKYDKILIVGGECKAIVAAKQLNKYGIGAVCATTGEGNWDIELSRQFKNKTAWVCLDIDVAGMKSANDICLYLCRVADWISEPIILPLNRDEYPKGDINDFVVAPINGLLKPLLDAAEQFVPKAKLLYNDSIEPVHLDLVRATHADNTAKRLSVNAVISTLDTSPYIIPKEIEILCNKDQKECAVCSVFIEDNSVFTIPPESPSIIDLVNAPKHLQLDIVKSAIGVPSTCKACDFKCGAYYNVEDARISPQLEITNRSADRVMQPALCIGDGVDLNESYELVGRMFPHPKTQQSTLLISKYTPTQDALSNYKTDDLSHLGVFWPQEWSVDAIQNKLDEIYTDLSSNVTRIFKRQDIHFATDLVYHSPLLLTFDGKRGIKGWMEGLILGDSSQGKSDVVCGTTGEGGLMAHYGLGTKVDCRNATVAGLLGGLQNLSGRHFASWGIIPTQDKRLVVMEELKGANPEVISKLTDMRSSGVAEIPKIEKRRTHARTRLIMLSNPRSQMSMETYNFGIDAIKELVGGLEDIRRFDFALIVSKSEIDPKELNRLQQERPQVEHTYTSELCRQLILWAWTRNETQVEFTDEARAAILAESTALSEIFSDNIPLVDRGSMRYKLARMSASLAARTFSCSEDYATLIVHEAHVQYVSEFLRRIYSSSVFGYLDYTNAQQVAQTLIDEPKIIETISATPYPSDLIKQLIAKNRIDLTDLQDWCGWEREQATILLSFFVRKHALFRDNKAYRKSAKFITLLKHLLQSNNFVDRPPYIGGGEY